MRYVIIVGKILVTIGVFVALRQESSRQLTKAFDQFGSLFQGAIDDTAQAVRLVNAAADGVEAVL